MTIHFVPRRRFELGQTEIRPILLQRSDSSATSEGIKCCWPGYDLTPALSVASERTGATPTRLLAESSRDTVGPSTEVHASLGPRSQHHRSQAFLPCDTSNTLQAVGLHHQLLTRILFLVYCVNVDKNMFKLHTVLVKRVRYFVLLNNSYKSWSIIKTRDSSEICSS